MEGRSGPEPSSLDLTGMVLSGQSPAIAAQTGATPTVLVTAALQQPAAQPAIMLATPMSAAQSTYAASVDQPPRNRNMTLEEELALRETAALERIAQLPVDSSPGAVIDALRSEAIEAGRPLLLNELLYREIQGANPDVFPLESGHILFRDPSRDGRWNALPYPDFLQHIGPDGAVGADPEWRKAFPPQLADRIAGFAGEYATDPDHLREIAGLKAQVQGIATEMAPHLRAELVERLYGGGQEVVDSGALGMSRQPVAGLYFKSLSAIAVSGDQEPWQVVETTFHELYEGLANFLIPSERAALLRALPALERALQHVERQAVDADRKAITDSIDALAKEAKQLEDRREIGERYTTVTTELEAARFRLGVLQRMSNPIGGRTPDEKMAAVFARYARLRHEGKDTRLFAEAYRLATGGTPTAAAKRSVVAAVRQGYSNRGAWGALSAIKDEFKTGFDKLLGKVDEIHEQNGWRTVESIFEDLKGGLVAKRARVFSVDRPVSPLEAARVARLAKLDALAERYERMAGRADAGISGAQLLGELGKRMPMSDIRRLLTEQAGYHVLKDDGRQTTLLSDVDREVARVLGRASGVSAVKVAPAGRSSRAAPASAPSAPRLVQLHHLTQGEFVTRTDLPIREIERTSGSGYNAVKLKDYVLGDPPVVRLTAEQLAPLKAATGKDPDAATIRASLHKAMIHNAIQLGRLVPDTVLADYPDLARIAPVRVISDPRSVGSAQPAARAAVGRAQAGGPTASLLAGTKLGANPVRLSLGDGPTSDSLAWDLAGDVATARQGPVRFAVTEEGGHRLYAGQGTRVAEVAVFGRQDEAFSAGNALAKGQPLDAIRRVASDRYMDVQPIGSSSDHDYGTVRRDPALGGGVELVARGGDGRWESVGVARDGAGAELLANRHAADTGADRIALGLPAGTGFQPTGSARPAVVDDNVVDLQTERDLRGAARNLHLVGDAGKAMLLDRLAEELKLGPDEIARALNRVVDREQTARRYLDVQDPEDRRAALTMGAKVDARNRALYIPPDLGAEQARALLTSHPLHADVSRSRLYIDPMPTDIGKAEAQGAAYDPIAQRYYVPNVLDRKAADALTAAFGSAEARDAATTRFRSQTEQRAQMGAAARETAAALGAPLAHAAIVSREEADRAKEVITRQMSLDEVKGRGRPQDRPADYNGVLQALADILFEGPARFAGRQVTAGLDRLEKGPSPTRTGGGSPQPRTGHSYSLGAGGETPALTPLDRQPTVAQAPSATEPRVGSPPPEATSEAKRSALLLPANDAEAMVKLRQQIAAMDSNTLRRQELTQVAAMRVLWGSRIKLDTQRQTAEGQVTGALGLIRQEMAARLMPTPTLGQKAEGDLRSEIAQRRKAATKVSGQGMG